MTTFRMFKKTSLAWEINERIKKNLVVSKLNYSGGRKRDDEQKKRKE